MKTLTNIAHSFIALFLLMVSPGLLYAQAMEFTYQGRLNSVGSYASGNYDFTFALFNTNSTNTGQVGSALTNLDVGVTNGHFIVTLNFGDVFTGTNYWLAVSVRTNGGGGFTALSPLQAVMPTPYAIYAYNAGSAAASNLTGVLSASNLPASVALLNSSPAFTGTVTASNFSGTFGGTLAPQVMVPASQIPPGNLTMAQITINSGNLAPGTGLISTTYGSHLWTNNTPGGFNHNHQWEFFVIGNDQYQFYFLSPTVGYSGQPAIRSYDNVAWQFYTNALQINQYPPGTPNMYQSVIDTGGGYHVQGQDTDNDGGITLGSGINTFKMYIATDPIALAIQCQGVTGLGFPSTFFSAQNGALPNAITITENGVSIGNWQMASSNSFEVATPSGTNSFAVGADGVTTVSQGLISLANNTLPPTSIAFPATCVRWTNTTGKNIEVYIDNNGVTGTGVQKNGTVIFTSVTGCCTFHLQPGEYFSEAYSVGTPTATWSPE